MRILLVEDDSLIGTAVKQALQDSGYPVDWMTNGQQAISAVKVQAYGAILLDLGLPGKNGFEVLRELRLSSIPAPVIIITARDAVEDRIKGLDLGADDFLVKPFSVSELQARIRAVVRRSNGVSNPVLESSDMSLDPSTCQITREGKVYTLTGREFALMHTLMLHPGKVFSRNELEEHIYGWNEEVASNAIEFLIHSLRKKLGKDAIKNIRGLGWLVNK
ncbi:response regulator [Spartinivicinus poritis]|uniref:Response regulator transcription factor n=1 Tax=Spartinivicinus poritis TaxID=2994640 RepID=A0ABT5UB88_9GAMM|nr:response regulator transcription factor [Spartinivicinus sp. A2-2]MDE1463623.1 response regulator transcription factor [Spartinivicinus sp. A2-2]